MPKNEAKQPEANNSQPTTPAPTFESELAKLQLTPKQQASLTGLLAEIARLRGDTCKVTNPHMNPADARKLIVLVNGVRVQIGPGGGYEALDIRTYPKATTTFMACCDTFYAKQSTRDAAKAAAAVASVTAAAAANVAAVPVVEAAATVSNK